MVLRQAMDWRTETSLLHSARRRRYLRHNRERHDLNQNQSLTPIRTRIPNRPNLIHPSLIQIRPIHPIPIHRLPRFQKSFRL